MQDRANIVRTGLVYGGFAIAVAAVLILATIWGFDPFVAGASPARRAIPTAAVLVLAAIACAVLVRAAPAAFYRFIAAALAARGAGYAVALALAAGAAAALITKQVLQAFPISGDAYAYLFQADVFGQGRLWLKPFPIQKYVDAFYIFDIHGKLVSQYPPGWPAVLAAAKLLALPVWLVDPVIGGLTVVALYAFAAHACGRGAAAAAVAIFAGSSFFLFNSASFLSHGVVALYGVLFAWFCSRYLERPSAGLAAGMGLCLSAVAVTRHYDAVLLAVPAAFPFILNPSRSRWRFVPVMVLAGLPLMLGLMAYYAAVTGNPLQTPMTLVDPSDRLLGPNYHVGQSIAMIFGRGVELGEWVSPPFVVAYVASLVMTAYRRKIRFYDCYGPVFVLGYALYWGAGGLRWGPRYIYPAFPFMAVTLAAAVWDAIDRPAIARLARGLVHLGVLSLIASLLQVPYLAVGAARVVHQLEDVATQAKRAGVHHAVIVLASGTGVIWKISIGGLVRNYTTLTGDIVYAHSGDILAANVPADRTWERALAALRHFFPDRKFFIYRRDPGDPVGRLIPLDAGTKP